MAAAIAGSGAIVPVGMASGGTGPGGMASAGMVPGVITGIAVTSVLVMDTIILTFTALSVPGVTAITKIDA